MKNKRIVISGGPGAGKTSIIRSLKDKGYSLLGVSADNEKRQKNFADKFELPFPLLADEDKTVIETFGVWGPKKFQGKEYEGIHRMTFILDENAIVERVIDKVKTKDEKDRIVTFDLCFGSAIYSSIGYR